MKIALISLLACLTSCTYSINVFNTEPTEVHEELINDSMAICEDGECAQDSLA